MQISPNKMLIMAGMVLVNPLVGNSQNVLSGKPAYSYSSVREADIMWMKRIWRRIDLREKMNHPLYFPENPSNGRMSLFDHLTAAIREGTIAAYDPGPLGEDDMFNHRMSQKEIEQLLIRTEIVMVDRLNEEGRMEQTVELPIKTSEILMYEIKEDWFFDKQRSVMEVRIVGICPMMRMVDENTGDFRGYKKLFWINFQESRNELATWGSFNRGNDMERRTFDELFNKRMFDSYIVKESNVYDRAIIEYASGVDALLEAEKIEEKLFVMEHDLWSY